MQTPLCGTKKKVHCVPATLVCLNSPACNHIPMIWWWVSSCSYGLGNFAQVFHPFAQTIPSAGRAFVQPMPTCNICLSIITSQGKPLLPRTNPLPPRTKPSLPWTACILCLLPSEVLEPCALTSHMPEPHCCRTNTMRRCSAFHRALHSWC